jgi:hypothetical protein
MREMMDSQPGLMRSKGSKVAFSFIMVWSQRV